MFRFYTLLVFAFCLLSCKKEEKSWFISLTSQIEMDTLYVTELITEQHIALITESSSTKLPNLKHTKLARIHSNNDELNYLTILSPQKDVNISVLTDSTLATRDSGDSLVNYLWKSNLRFIRDNSAFIFNTKNTDSILNLFKDFKIHREKQIDFHNDKLNSEESELLHFQNNARIYSFLFFLGRLSKGLAPNHGFFDFIDDIPQPSIYLKTLPAVYLYKYEVEYLRKYKSLDNIENFINFIEERTDNEDLANFLKVIYIKNLIELPSYWQRHEKLFNTEALQKIVKVEQKNPYYNLIEKPMENFMASQNGKTAYDFSAIDELGQPLKLNDLSGKIVFIDVWATWCAPCLRDKPKVLALAQKYDKSEDVEVLMISVDSNKDKWLSFLENKKHKYRKNLIIENGMNSEFGSNYNIKSIPRYILIGRNGKIINANMTEPSFATEEAIEREIKIN